MRVTELPAASFETRSNFHCKAFCRAGSCNSRFPESASAAVTVPLESKVHLTSTVPSTRAKRGIRGYSVMATIFDGVQSCDQAASAVNAKRIAFLTAGMISSQQLCQIPDVIGDASFHGRSNAVPAVNPVEIVVGDEQGRRCPVVLKLLREAVRRTLPCVAPKLPGRRNCFGNNFGIRRS